MAWVTIGTAAVGLVGGAINARQQGKAAGDAAAAGAAGNAAAIASQERARDQMRGDLQPYMGMGGEAVLRLGELGRGDMSNFYESPDYQFTLDQGFQGLDRSASANGRLMSGGHSADLLRYGQGMASQQFNQYRSNLMGLAGMGQNAAAGVGSAGMQAAGQIGGYQSATGAGNAAGIQGRADANSQLVAGVSGAIQGGLQQWGAQRASSYAGSPGSNANFGNNPGFQNTNWGGAQAGSLTGTPLGGNPFAPRG